MIKYFFLILISFSFHFIKPDNIIELKFAEDTSNGPQIINICVGKKDQCIDLVLDINTGHTFIQSINNPMSDIEKINEKSSNIEILSKNEKLRFINKKSIDSNLIQSSIFINKKEIKNIKYHSAIQSEDFGFINGILGLGYSTDLKESEINLLTQLKESKQIDYQSYYIKYTELQKGTLKLGYIPDFVDDYENTFYCENEMTFYGEWGCQINGILIGDDILKDKMIKIEADSFIFDYNSPKNLFPVSYLLKLEKEYFGIYIKRGDCFFGIKNDYYTFTCDNKEVMSLPDISIVTEYWAINFPINELFTYNIADREYEFNFYGIDDNEYFVFGIPLLKEIELGLFLDREEMYFKTSNKNRITQVKKRTPPEKPIKPKKNDNDNNSDNTHIDEDYRFLKGIIKFLIIIIIILIILYLGLLTLRLCQKKKFVDSNYFYKAGHELFNENE